MKKLFLLNLLSLLSLSLVSCKCDIKKDVYNENENYCSQDEYEDNLSNCEFDFYELDCNECDDKIRIIAKKLIKENYVKEVMIDHNVLCMIDDELENLIGENSNYKYKMKYVPKDIFEENIQEHIAVVE